MAIYSLSRIKPENPEPSADPARWDAPLSNLRFAFRCRHDDVRTVDMITSACVDITGYAAEEILSGRLGLIDLVDPSDKDVIRYQVRRAVIRFLPFDFTYRIRAKGGASIWVCESSRPVLSMDGDVVIAGFVELIQTQSRPSGQTETRRVFGETPMEFSLV